MGEEADKVNNKGKNKGHANLIPLKKGQTANPNGRPKGQRNYATIYREALIRLADKNNKTPEELEEEILSVGLLSARKGNYAFYKDLLDRIHGTATQKTDITTDGQPITTLSDDDKTKLLTLLDDKTGTPESN